MKSYPLICTLKPTLQTKDLYISIGKGILPIAIKGKIKKQKVFKQVLS